MSEIDKQIETQPSSQVDTYSIYPGFQIRKETVVTPSEQLGGDPETLTTFLMELHNPPEGLRIRLKTGDDLDIQTTRSVIPREVNYIEIQGKFFGFFGDAWGNPFIAEYQQPVPQEKEEAFNAELSQSIMFWEMAAGDLQPMISALKEVFSAEKVDSWVAMTDFLKDNTEYLDITRLDDSIDLAVLAQSPQLKEAFLKMFKYRPSSSEEITEILRKFESSEDLTEKEQVIVQVFKNYRVLINFYSTLPGPYRISDANQTFALANLAEHTLAGSTTEDASEAHEENYQRVVDEATVVGHQAVAAAFLEQKGASMQYGFGAGSLGGKPYTVLVFADTNRERTIRVIDHERFHDVLRGLRPDESLPKAEFECEEGFVDAAACLIAAQGDLSKALELNRKDFNAYTPAVETLLNILHDLAVAQQRSEMTILLEALQKFSAKEIRFPLDEIQRQYNEIPSVIPDKFRSRMDVYNDNNRRWKSISLSSRSSSSAESEEVEEEKPFVPERMIAQIESLTYQDFLDWCAIKNEYISSWDNEEEYLKQKKSVIKEFQESSNWLFSSVRVGSTARKFFRDLIETSEYSDEIKKLTVERYKRHISTLKSALVSDSD